MKAQFARFPASMVTGRALPLAAILLLVALAMYPAGLALVWGMGYAAIVAWFARILWVRAEDSPVSTPTRSEIVIVLAAVVAWSAVAFTLYQIGRFLLLLLDAMLPMFGANAGG